ncbi:hypothetical protein Purlil1_3099 [Purpureocillium lilacinum]|uniref:Uncharacterized protein n=1 Tax=Purpureocillium lilacinum TaxID=33203 RepID=A0ABR0C9P1_PURLI|nr:hypothetical protein Purlil1_3099 [Purpureocillium lilacinum]
MARVWWARARYPAPSPARSSQPDDAWLCDLGPSRATFVSMTQPHRENRSTSLSRCFFYHESKDGAEGTAKPIVVLGGDCGFACHRVYGYCVARSIYRATDNYWTRPSQNLAACLCRFSGADGKYSHHYVVVGIASRCAVASQVRRWLWILQKQPEKGYLKQHELLHDRPARSVKLGIPICVWRTGIRKGTAPAPAPGASVRKERPAARIRGHDPSDVTRCDASPQPGQVPTRPCFEIGGIDIPRRGAHASRSPEELPCKRRQVTSAPWATVDPWRLGLGLSSSVALLSRPAVILGHAMTSVFLGDDRRRIRQE